MSKEAAVFAAMEVMERKGRLEMVGDEPVTALGAKCPNVDPASGVLEFRLPFDERPSRS